MAPSTLLGPCKHEFYLLGIDSENIPNMDNSSLLQFTERAETLQEELWQHMLEPKTELKDRTKIKDMRLKMVECKYKKQCRVGILFLTL